MDKITAYFDRGLVEHDITLQAYTLGLRLKRWEFAERGLLLRAQRWPELAADSYFRMGNLYMQAGPGYERQALQAFRQGWSSVPSKERRNYQQQVPSPYREQL